MKIPIKVAMGAFVALSLFSVIVIAYPFMSGRYEGELTVKWSSPKGLVLRNLVEGDTVEVSYESGLPLSVYLLSLSRAEELRRPTFYKDELPSPFLEGSSGSSRVRIDGSGDMELLFWNASFTTDQTVHYIVKVHRTVLTIGMLVSGCGLLVLCIGGAVVLLRKGGGDGSS